MLAFLTDLAKLFGNGLRKKADYIRDDKGTFDHGDSGCYELRILC